MLVTIVILLFVVLLNMSVYQQIFSPFHPTRQQLLKEYGERCMDVA